MAGCTFQPQLMNNHYYQTAQAQVNSNLHSAISNNNNHYSHAVVHNWINNLYNLGCIY